LRAVLSPTAENAIEQSRAEVPRPPAAPERVSRWAAKSARRPAVRAAGNGRRIQETKNMLPRSIKVGRSLTMATLAVAFVACNDNDRNVVAIVTPLNQFTLASLVADQGVATTIDPNLVNPWGIAFGPTGLLWVSNNGTGTSTVYNGNGSKVPTTVTIPGADGAQGVPTGVVLNTTGDFVIVGVGPVQLPAIGAAAFIFAGEDGTISAWNPSAPNNSAVIVADRSATGAVYKGIAMAQNGGANFLYATNFHANAVDVYDKNFVLVNSFTDASMPAGFAPFGIASINGKLYVSYAKQKAPDNKDDDAGLGNGFIDVFNPDGSLSKRLVSAGALNSPWAMVIAPTGFSRFAGDLIVGNFGDGLIAAYDPNTGAFIDNLRGGDGNAIQLSGLWGLAFGPFPGSTIMYFSSGPNDETHGLVGTLTPVVQ
jgi:uncharacterized protein (TIGR03118 family)